MKLNDIILLIKKIPKKYWNKSVNIAKKYRVPTVVIFFDRIWCKIIYGVNLSDEYEYFGVYRLNHLERKNLFTTGRFFKTCKWFFTPKMIKTVDEKKGFCINFQEFLKRDFLLLPCEQESLMHFLKTHKVLYVKMNVSCGGFGVNRYSAEELINNKTLLEKITSLDGVAEELIIQHPQMAALNPDAVSTLRIVTLIEKNGNINIMSAALRMGRKRAIVDNASSGGYIFEISPEGIVVGYGKTHSGIRTLTSATGLIMPGFHIPFWNEVIAMVKKAAAKFPDARLVGWDVAIGVDGPLLVEANMSTGPTVMQFGDYGCWNYIRSQK